MTRLLLASASPARATTLRAAGITPLIAVADVDEPALLQAALADAGGHLPARDQVLLLATAKARWVASRIGGFVAHGTLPARPGFVLGCDSMLELHGELVGKPGDAATAVARWRGMRGREGLLHTGHFLLRVGDEPAERWPFVGDTSTTRVRFADLSDAEIQAYVGTGEPLRVAGAFTIDGLGGPYVESIEGDHHGVVGLSLPALRRLLRDLGTAIHELWDTAGEASGR